jgi:hypothetical protein
MEALDNKMVCSAHRMAVHQESRATIREGALFPCKRHQLRTGIAGSRGVPFS